MDDYFHLQNSGVVDHRARHSVAIAIIKACQASVHLKGVAVNLKIMTIYVPRREAEEEAKGAFLHDLQGAIGGASSGDMLRVAGDCVTICTWRGSASLRTSAGGSSQTAKESQR